MKPVFHTLAITAAALLPLAVMLSCNPASPDYYFGSLGVGNQDVKSQMAISFKSGVGRPATKMSDSVTQIDAEADYTAFRGIEQIYVIPFNTYRAVTASDLRHGRNLQLPQRGISPQWGSVANAGLVSNNNSHLYQSVYMRSGTASVLVYGKAIDESVCSASTGSRPRNPRRTCGSSWNRWWMRLRRRR